MYFPYITSGKQMNKDYALYFNQINFAVIPSYIELPCSENSYFPSQKCIENTFKQLR